MPGPWAEGGGGWSGQGVGGVGGDRCYRGGRWALADSARRVPGVLSTEACTAATHPLASEVWGQLFGLDLQYSLGSCRLICGDGVTWGRQLGAL